MKCLVYIAVLAVCVRAVALSIEDVSPHFSAGAQIIWKAPTNDLPKTLWTYKRLPPRPFSVQVISNAIAMASLQDKAFPKPSTNDFYLAEDKGPNYPGPLPVYFSITPKSGTIFYSLPHPDTNTADIPADAILIQRAWGYALNWALTLHRLNSRNLLRASIEITITMI